jgi:nucleoside triphosphate diphosphatase
VEHKQSDALDRVMDLVRYLRAHCPWDAAQTHRSLIPYLLEESHETVDAINQNDDDALRAELGDLLLNVAFQIVLAEERAVFRAGDVADAVITKMQRRHPHLYGLGDAEEWESMKARERSERASILHGLASGLDPLSRAQRIQDRVASIGFDWADASGAFEKVVEELEEVREELYNCTTAQLQNSRTAGQHDSRTAERHKSRTAEQQNSRTAERHDSGTAERQDGTMAGPVDRPVAGAALEEELGDLMFAVVNLTRLAGVHALTALQGANAKFSRRFVALERLAAERGVVLEEVGLEELDRLWEEIKGRE